MPRVFPVKTPLDAASLPGRAWRALCADLGDTGRDPLPPMGGRRWLRRFPHVLVVIYALYFGLTHARLLTSVYSFSGGALPEAVAAAQFAAVVLAMFRPLPALWLSLGATAAGAVGAKTYQLPGESWPWLITGLLAHAMVLLLLSLRRPVRVAGQAVVLSVGFGALLEWLTGDHLHTPTVLLSAIVFTGVTVVGASLRARREAKSQLVEQEVLTAEERTRRTVLEERSRIARELHDVVAHHMSVISIQAQVAPHLVADPPPELRENLDGIRQNALDALTELRRVLGVLRSEDPTGAEAAPHAPLPTLDRLDSLLDNARAAGLTVTHELSGERRALAPGVELSAYRIVQEALSNALRHAPGAQVRVELGYAAPGLRVRITNTAPAKPAPAGPGTGHGLLGMRERAAMLGGELATGTTPDGGYEVTAFLPNTSGEKQT
ncbi:two-component sensor histidine kinase [Streptomyces purpureus]|uniref:histidine kinase n=1 Tax=Streptomyces purpureus TaxID=1951 RepID=A0A918LQT1_9ACTN|nr:two-component sensor histidine kinase [Streptomyces purpureus]